MKFADWESKMDETVREFGLASWKLFGGTFGILIYYLTFRSVSFLTEQVGVAIRHRAGDFVYHGQEIVSWRMLTLGPPPPPMAYPEQYRLFGEVYWW